MTNEHTEEIMGWIREAKDVVGVQAPAIAEEALRWGIWSHSLGLALGIVAVLFGLWCVHRINIQEGTPWDDPDNPDNTLYIVGLAAGLIFGAIAIFANTYNVVMVMIAPKLYLISLFT